MSTDLKGSAQVDTANAGGEANEQSNDSKDVVSYDTYKRTLAEAKAAKEKARTLAAERAGLEERLQKLLVLEQRENEQKGNYEANLKAIQAERDAAKALAQKSQASIQNYVKADAIKKVALAHNVRQDALSDVLKIGDWSGVDVIDADTGLQADEAAITEAITKMAKEKPYLFAKPAGSTKEVIMGGSAPATKSLSNMKPEDLENQFRQQFRK